jgi:HNH endonuclease/Helix-turn-helix domain of resolvase
MAEGQSTAVSSVEYRDIPGFSGYRAGSDGSIWSYRRKKPLRLKPSHIRGYCVVSLYRGKKRSGVSVKVHQAVLRSFVGRPPDGHVCRHLDGNKANNSLSNLAWGTHLENSSDKFRHGTHLSGEPHPSTKLTDEQVAGVLSMLAEGYSQSQVARRFDCSQQNVSRIAAGKRKPSCKR